MNPKQRESALTWLAHIQANASTLHDLLSRCSDVRTDHGAPTWLWNVETAYNALRPALAEVSRYAVL
jgi:hypothetical protein